MARYLEISEATYTSFMQLKATLAEMANESVSDDEVLDFIVRSVMSSVEMPEDEHHNCCCCHEHTQD